MNILFATSFLSICTASTAFQFSPHPTHRSRPAQSVTSLWSSADSSDDDDGSKGQFDVAPDELDETILRINFSYDDGKGSLALAVVQKYTQSFPFAAVLPVQPLTYLPVKMPDGNPAVKVTFLRKKTAEKGSMDGGMIFSSGLVSEEDYEDGTLQDYKKNIQLTAWRNTKGQTISKIFSEKQVILAFVKGLHEGKGEELLMDGGNVVVDSVFHPWM